MPKIAISAKIDATLLLEVEKTATHLKIPKNRAFEEGLQLWVTYKNRQSLAEDMKKASLSCRKESLKNAQEWDVTLIDGIKNYEKR